MRRLVLRGMAHRLSALRVAVVRRSADLRRVTHRRRAPCGVRPAVHRWPLESPRSGDAGARWLEGLSADVLNAEFGRCRSLDEERAILRAFITRAREGDVAGMTLAQFAGFGDGANRINLSSLHSAKGREFEAVVLFGMNDGRIPRANAGDGERREARRLFYVGFTRAKQELHMMYSGGNPSPFVTEVRDQLDE